MNAEATIVMDEETIRTNVRRLAQEILNDNPDVESLVLLGILSRGRPLADRIAEEIRRISGAAPRVGSLGVTLYRDDLRSGSPFVGELGGGQTHFDFSVDNVTVVLVDDVLAAGRTVRAAMDEVMDYGRPRRIQLACLIDRGGRELPIQSDYLGWPLATNHEDYVSVRLREMDGEDVVLLERGVRAVPKGGNS